MKKKKEESFGERVRRLREARDMSLEALSRDTGYPEEFLNEIEEDRVAPPVAAVLQLNRVLNIEADRQEGASGKEAARKRTTSRKKRVASYAYESLATPAGEGHLSAYRVTIEPETEHQGVEYHHDGEEFIYVLEGGLKIQVGRNTRTLKKGGCINFDSSISHKLSNPAGEKAELLVVVYVP